MAMHNISNIIDIEPWYIPMDILRIICIISSIIIAVVLLVVIGFNKTCHTVPMMLVANTCLAELACVCTALGLVIFTLKNDLKQIAYEDSLCVFRSYINFGLTVIQNHSYNLEAIYRYFIVVHPTRLQWQSRRFQICLILITWIFGLSVFTPLLLIGSITYNYENQVCFPPLQLSFSIIYVALVIYIILNIILNIVYLKLVRYIHEMNKRVITTNVLARAQRELKMVKNIVTITTILVILGFPMAVFIIMSFFTVIPKYHFRIAFIFIDLSTTAVLVALFKTTEPVKTAVLQKFNTIAIGMTGTTS